MKDPRNYKIEANRISAYLVSEPLLDKEYDLYCQAMEYFDLELSNYEQMLLSSMLTSTWKMACIDAGLALKDPGNVIRRKIFTMLSILEASPNYTSYFLSRKFHFLYFVKIAFVGCRSVGRALIGILIIKNIKSKCK